MPSKTTTVNPFSVLGDTLESAADTFEEATSNAQESARKAAATTKRAVGAGVYKASYGISYGIVYSAAFLTQLLAEDNSIRRGFVEGADAALEKRKEIEAAKKSPIVPIAKARSRRAKATVTPALAKARKAVKARAAKFDAA